MIRDLSLRTAYETLRSNHPRGTRLCAYSRSSRLVSIGARHSRPSIPLPAHFYLYPTLWPLSQMASSRKPQRKILFLCRMNARLETMALVTLAFLNQRSHATCWFPNGNVAGDDTPCTDLNVTGDGYVPCCGPGRTCLPDRLCSSIPGEDSFLSRGSCTDKSWTDPNCPKACLQCRWQWICDLRRMKLIISRLSRGASGKLHCCYTTTAQ